MKKAESEKHYEDIKAEVEAMRKKITSNKSNDLTRFKTEIQELLEQEIVTRYYFQKGGIEASFDDDPDIKAAVTVLKDQGKYKSLLTASAKK